MKTVLKIIGLILLTVLVVPSLRQKALSMLFPPKYEKGISIDKLKEQTDKYKTEHGLPIKTFNTANMKVNIYSITEWTPKEATNALDADYTHYLVLNTSVENLSDKPLEAGLFNATYFLEDNTGKMAHCRLENFTGYYEENKITQDKSIIDRYYTGNIEPKTALQPKLFFFPMRADAKVAKIHFDDPISKEQVTFDF